MREIKLGRSELTTIVDDDDFDLVAGHAWGLRRHRRNLYVHESASCCGKYRQLHRVIMGALPGQQVDHRDGNGLNNTRSNLRITTNSQNAANRRKQAGSSAFKGVRLVQSRVRPWYAAIKKDGRRTHLGCFLSEVDAAHAYDTAARLLFGEFAALNFPLPGERNALDQVTPLQRT